MSSLNSLKLNKKGITIVETLIAAFLTMVAVVSLMPMFSLSLQTSAKSDYLGRAVGILQQELEFREEQVMQGIYPAASPTTYDQTVKVSGLDAKEGDVTIILKTKMTKQGNNAWIVNVQVTWTGNSTGFKNSIIVTPQMDFIQKS